MIGLDALFTSTEWENQGTKVAVKRIADFLGGDFQVYSEMPQMDIAPSVPTKLAGVLDDIYELRNQFAHGTWPDKQWAGRVCRRNVDSTRDVYYAELLSEAASVFVRGCLRKILADAKAVDLFSDKAKMNAHFASRGLVRRRKK